MSLLEITELTHEFSDKPLYRNAELAIYKGEHIGVVGQNGAGKSTLIQICTGKMIPDKGMISWQPGIKLGFLDQYAEDVPDITIGEFLKSAFSGLFQIEEKINELYEQLSEQNEDVLHTVSRYQEMLEQSGFYFIDTQIEKVVSGLGLAALEMERRLADISGGQRAKVILGKLLLEEPDVLLLDEPTNFLDKEHVAWLSEFLSASKKAFLVVSHDFVFLEKISTHICDIAQEEIRKYTGKYSAFLKQKEHLNLDYCRRYEAQQKEIQKTEEFIRKNIAGIKSRNAKGRRKKLERLERLTPPVAALLKPVFQFQQLPAPSQEHLSLNHLSVGYLTPLVTDLNVTIQGGQKVVVTGFNGVGKSTLLKTLLYQLPALGGSFSYSDNIFIGYYSQELEWQDKSKTPIQIISDAYPAFDKKEVRRQLSRCGITSIQAIQRVDTLSGGEQAKLKLCLLTLKSCNFLILDEPTNHLDQQAKEVLKEALQKFSGTVLLVSHEEEFYKDFTDSIIDIGKSMRDIESLTHFACDTPKERYLGAGKER